MVGQSGLGCSFTGRTAARSPSNGVTERENFINNFHFLCVEPKMILFSFVLPFRRSTEGLLEMCNVPTSGGGIVFSGISREIHLKVRT